MSLVSCRLSSWRALAALVFFAPFLRSRADVVLEWNEILSACAARATAEQNQPHGQARAFAMAHLAMDAAVATAANVTPRAEARLMVQRCAATVAAQEVLRAVLPEDTKRLDDFASFQLARIPTGAAKSRGEEIGHAAAMLVLQKRAADGWTEIDATARPVESPPTPQANSSGDWKPSSSPWLTALPFVLKHVDQFAPGEPICVRCTGEVVPNFAITESKLFRAVDRARLDRTIAFWSEAPLLKWNNVGRVAAERAQLDLAGEGRLFAVLNLALADASLAVFHARYVLGGWRPVKVDAWTALEGTAEQPGDVIVHLDDGLDTMVVRRDTRTVLLPPLRDYPSLDAALGGAAQAVIVTVLKSDQIAIALPLPATLAGADELRVPRVYASVSAAARECAFAGSLNGRHSREACIAGYELGATIGTYIAKHAATTRGMR